MKLLENIITLCVFVGIMQSIQLKQTGKNLCKRDIAYTTTEITVLSTKQFIHKVVCCKMHVTTCQQYCGKGGVNIIYKSYSKVVAKLRTEYFCCKGWTNIRHDKTETDECSIPVCNGNCDVGTCLRPNTCQLTYNSQLGFQKDVLKQDQCNENIINTAGSIKVYGNDRQSILKTQFCRYVINIPYQQTTYLYFEDFNFSPERTCAETLVTILTQKLEFLFCSDRMANLREMWTLSDTRIVIEVIKQSWSKNDGFELHFSDKKING